MDQITDELIAERLFGWRWLRKICTPVKGTPGYPEKMPVRRLYSPMLMTSPKWKDYLKDAVPADGTEPLAYCYCSSCGPEFVPPYTQSMDAAWLVVNEMRLRGVELSISPRSTPIEICRQALQHVPAA